MRVYLLPCKIFSSKVTILPTVATLDVGLIPTCIGAFYFLQEHDALHFLAYMTSFIFTILPFWLELICVDYKGYILVYTATFLLQLEIMVKKGYMNQLRSSRPVLSRKTISRENVHIIGRLSLQLRDPSTCLILTVVAYLNLEMFQTYLKIALLPGELDGNIYGTTNWLWNQRKRSQSVLFKTFHI